jgi:spermidine synthase
MLIASASTAMPAAWWAAVRLPVAIATQLAVQNVEFGAIVWSQALQVALLLLPMTAALGATFPLALATAGREDVGANAARVYTANTVGAILGALAAGFLLIPLLGLRGTFTAAAALALLTAVAGLARLSRRALTIGAAAAAAAVLVAVLLPPWDRGLLSSGGYKYAPYIAGGGAADLDQILRAGTLDYYKEGAAGTVSVRTLTGTRSLAIDGKIDASNAGDMLTQRLLGLLPVLIHGHARTVAVIGLGSGVTSGSALVPATAGRMDVIEISPEVVEASRFFDAESGAVLSRPEIRLIVGDGRSHLRLSSQRYDVIVSEPSNPWMAGVASLFTGEFFEAARARLEPDGLLCQWAHTYDISAPDLRSIVRTFGSVFPDGSMWLVGEGDLLLIGSNGATVASRLDAVNRSREGAIASTLATVGVAPGTGPFDLLSLYVGGPREITKYAGDALIQTDDRNPLEYTAPRGIYSVSSGENARALRALSPELPPAVAAAIHGAAAADWASRGRMELQAEAPAIAYDAFRHAVEMDARNEAALKGLTEAAAGSGRQAEARAWLEAAARREPTNALVRVELSRLQAADGNLDAAVQTAAEAARLAPDDPRPLEQLASVVSDAGDLDRLQPVVDSLAARFPARLDGQYYRASALFQQGRVEEAATAAGRVTAAKPTDGRAQNLLGAACARLGRRECAKSAFTAAVAASPRDPAAYVNLGLLSLDAGDPASSARYFSEALTLDPRSVPARSGLSQARSLLGDPR